MPTVLKKMVLGFHFIQMKGMSRPISCGPWFWSGKFWLISDKETILASNIGLEPKNKNGKKYILENYLLIKEKWDEYDKAKKKSLIFVATDIEFKEDHFQFFYMMEVFLSVPYDLVPSLAQGKQETKENCGVAGMGNEFALAETLDEDLTVEGLVLGQEGSLIEKRQFNRIWHSSEKTRC